MSAMKQNPAERLGQRERDEITDDIRVQFDPMCDESVIGFQRIKVVTCRAPHVCFASYNPDNKPPKHTIKPGQRARYEFAIVDGSPHVSWHCIKCLDKMIRGNL